MEQYRFKVICYSTSLELIDSDYILNADEISKNEKRIIIDVFFNQDLVEKFATLYLVLILNEGKSGFYFQKLKFEDKEKNRSDFPYFIKFFDFQRELEMIYAFDKLARDIDGYDYPLEINKEYPIKWHYFAKQFKRWFEVVFLPFLYQELKFIKQHKLEK